MPTEVLTISLLHPGLVSGYLLAALFCILRGIASRMALKAAFWRAVYMLTGKTEKHLI